eukprot:6211876-Pleurochrysis_carterae.AAC.3
MPGVCSLSITQVASSKQGVSCAHDTAPPLSDMDQNRMLARKQVVQKIGSTAESRRAPLRFATCLSRALIERG